MASSGCSRCARDVEKLDVVLDRTLNVYNDKTGRFKPIHTINEKDEPLYPQRPPLRITEDGVDYVYFSDTLPSIRVRADWKAVQDPKAFEGYTCLPQGTRFDGDATKLGATDRPAEVGVEAATPTSSRRRRGATAAEREARRGRLRSRLIDVETKKPVATPAGRSTATPTGRSGS